MKTRIIFACGSAELLAASWLATNKLQTQNVRNVLVLYGRPISMPAQHVKQTLEQARAYFSWNRIIDLVTSQADPAPIAMSSIDELLDDEDASVLASADEILMHTIWNAVERRFLSLCANARVYLYDNGLDSHLPRTVRTADPADLGHGDISSYDLDRVELAMYTIGDLIEPPGFIAAGKVVVPSAGSLRLHLEKMAALHLALTANQYPEPRAISALLLGTSFYRNNRLGLDEEAALYRSMANEAEARGLVVAFKEHPRAPRPLFATSGGALTLPQSAPVEFFPLKSPVRLTASISSTALVSIKKIFGAPYVLLGDPLKMRRFLPWYDALLRHASDVKEVLT